MTKEILAYDAPKTVRESVIGELEVYFNDWGEFGIHNKYSKETWILQPEDAKSLRRFLNKRKLIQIHHQFKDRTEMVVQEEVGCAEEVSALVQEMKVSHPIPKDAQWMICEEGSEYFVTAPVGARKEEDEGVS